MTPNSDQSTNAKNMAGKDVALDAKARFNEIWGILKKHNLDEKNATPEKVVALLQDLGPTFIKLGQIASTHPELIPKEYCDALGKLRTKVEPMDIGTVKTQIENELGAPVDELFAEFDEKPVGSASIAQVHRAMLLDGSTEVAVKVQRPGVIETVSNDLAILDEVVKMYAYTSSEDEGMSLKKLVDELGRTSREELDFRTEAGNLERFYANNYEREGVTSPKYYAEVSTPAILVEDFFRSPAAEKIDELELADDERDKLAYLVSYNYLQQVLEDGFFHADPHAGNVLVTTYEKTEAGVRTTADGQIVETEKTEVLHGVQWIDFGMMGVMNAKDRNKFEELIGAIVKRDAYALKRAVLRVAKPRGAIDHTKLLAFCDDLVTEASGADLESIDTGALMNRLTEGLEKYGFELSPFLVTLGRGLVTLQGTVRLISPRLSLMQVMKDYLESTIDEEFIQKKIADMLGTGISSVEALAGLPVKAVDTLDMLQHGQVKVGFDVGATDSLEKMMDRYMGSFVLALIAAALIIGSCVLTNSSLIGSEFIGTAGFVTGLVLAIYTVVRVLRKNT